MTFSIKALRVNRSLSEETLCFSASLYHKNRRVGQIANRGHGGPNEINFKSKLAETDALKTACSSKPDATTQECWRLLDDQLDQLVHEAFEKQQHKDWCRHATVFRTSDQPDGEWHRINRRYSEIIANYIRQQYPDTVEILNERFINGGTA